MKRGWIKGLGVAVLTLSLNQFGFAGGGPRIHIPNAWDALGQAAKSGKTFDVTKLPSVQDIGNGRLTRLLKGMDPSEADFATKYATFVSRVGDNLEGLKSAVAELGTLAKQSEEYAKMHAIASKAVKDLEASRHWGQSSFAGNEASRRVAESRRNNLRSWRTTRDALSSYTQTNPAGAVVMEVTNWGSAHGVNVRAAKDSFVAKLSDIFADPKVRMEKPSFTTIQRFYEGVQAKINSEPDAVVRAVLTGVGRNLDPNVIFFLRSFDSTLGVNEMLGFCRMGLALTADVDVASLKESLSVELPAKYVAISEKVRAFTQSLVVADKGDGVATGTFRTREQAHAMVFRYFLKTFSPSKLNAEQGSLASRLDEMDEAKKSELLGDIVATGLTYKKLNTILAAVQDVYVKRTDFTGDPSARAKLRRHSDATKQCLVAR
jgi:hypothetical protein